MFHKSAFCNLNSFKNPYPFKRQSQSNELFECIWPFCEIGAKRVKLLNITVFGNIFGACTRPIATGNHVVAPIFSQKKKIFFPTVPSSVSSKLLDASYKYINNELF